MEFDSLSPHPLYVSLCLSMSLYVSLCLSNSLPLPVIPPSLIQLIQLMSFGSRPGTHSCLPFARVCVVTLPSGAKQHGGADTARSPVQGAAGAHLIRGLWRERAGGIVEGSDGRTLSNCPLFCPPWSGEQGEVVSLSVSHQMGTSETHLLIDTETDRGGGEGQRDVSQTDDTDDWIPPACPLSVRSQALVCRYTIRQSCSAYQCLESAA